MRLQLLAIFAATAASAPLVSAANSPPLRGAAHRQLAAASTVTYPPSIPYSAPLTNPERGFYSQVSYRASQPERLDVEDLASRREVEDQSIILRLYYLDAFMGGPISQDVLDDVVADFGAMKAAGVKCILRFAYTDSFGVASEPTKQVLLNHISQLSPVLTSNQDAILAVQAGFVGPWGEWHSSTNFGDDLEGRRDVVGGLLDAVPERIVQIRTPLHKRKLYAVDAGDVVHSDGHVANGDFEGSGVGSSWRAYMDGYLVETSDFNSGSQSVKVTNGAARQWVSLNAGEGYVIELSGWSKRVGATGSTPWDYSVYADVALDDGSYLWGKMAKFTGADTWNHAVYTFPVPSGKTVTGLNVYCMYRNVHNGYALFDDIAVTVYEPPSTVGADAIDATTAHDGSHISRTGHHNDCFLASDTDYGTYTAPHSASNTDEYDYLSQETKYTVMGGETCNPNPPRSECDKAKEEMELFHYTYLNSEYHQDVLSSWTSDGCMEEVAARLGYRFLLKMGTFGSGAAPGGAVPYSISIENVGYASPVNRRPFQVALKETTTGAICAASDYSIDVRDWFGGETHTVEGNLILPNDLPEGTYGLYLNLADESMSLRTDLSFKVKVANTGLNDEVTGLIDLQHSVTIATGQSSAPSTSGLDISVVCGMEQDVLPPVVGPPKLVKNGGFEGSPGNEWSNYRSGFTVDQTYKHSGDQSIKISNGGARQWVSLTAEAGSQVTIRGYSKAVGTSVGLWDYGIYADVSYADGSYLWGQIAKFPGGTHDFTLGEKTFVVPAGKTITGMSVYAMYRNDPISSGVAFFDDVEVTVKPPSTRSQ